MASYSASKFAVRGLTEALDLEWAKHGIRVADLMPPFVSTPMLNNQSFQAPVLRRLGVNLQAEAVAQAAWAQTQSRAVHRPISLPFNLLYWLGQLTPPWVMRHIMAWLSRE
jgi:NAD(P)-dependent dehydrogenase (short-subunit alcohol dehydrogenase family)